jgi:membrane carboxypeptidase/penicillin-binding protein
MRILYKSLFVVLILALLAVIGICGWMLAYTGDLPDIDHLSQFIPTSAIVISDPCQASSSTAIRLERIGKNLREAIETAEQKRSWSTQVARSLFCNSKERMLWFQMDSWRVDWQMRCRFSENQLFTIYANRVYLGQDLYGVQNASQHYFHKDAGDLTVEEAALIAGVISAPGAYSPFKSPEKALQRRNQVLAVMVAQGKLSQDAAARAETVPITPHVDNTSRSVEGTYRNPTLGYSINVPRGLKATTGGDAGPERGLTISTRTTRSRPTGCGT